MHHDRVTPQCTPITRNFAIKPPRVYQLEEQRERRELIGEGEEGGGGGRRGGEGREWREGDSPCVSRRANDACCRRADRGRSRRWVITAITGIITRSTRQQRQRRRHSHSPGEFPLSSALRRRDDTTRVRYEGSG